MSTKLTSVRGVICYKDNEMTFTEGHELSGLEGLEARCEMCRHYHEHMGGEGTCRESSPSPKFPVINRKGTCSKWESHEEYKYACDSVTKRGLDV